MYESDERWLTEERALLLIAVAASILAYVVVRPYLQFVLFAAVLAYVLVPVQVYFEQYLSPMAAALSITVGSVLTVILPLIYLLLLAGREGFALLRAFEDGRISIAPIENQLMEFGLEVDLVVMYETYREPITGAFETLAFETLDLVRGLPDLFIGLTILVFVLFSLLRDRAAVVDWSRNVTPIGPELHARFIHEVDKLMWASIVGNVAVAAIQALLLGLGLFILGLSNVLFYTFATFVLSLLPLVGAFVVWLPLSLYLFALGNTTTAAILFVYGSLVSVSDFYLRPAVIGKSGALSSAVVVVGIFGGIVVFGFVGLFIGPVIIGAAKLTLDIYAEESPDVVDT